MVALFRAMHKGRGLSASARALLLHLMTAAPGAARQILSDHQVDYIVICTGSLEQGDFVKLAPDGLAARLGRGEVPDFLRPVDLRLPGKLVAWRARRDGP